MSHVVLERARGPSDCKGRAGFSPQDSWPWSFPKVPSLLQLEWEQGRLRQVWWASVSRVDGCSFLMTSVPRSNLTV